MARVNHGYDISRSLSQDRKHKARIYANPAKPKRDPMSAREKARDGVIASAARGFGASSCSRRRVGCPAG